MLQNLPLSKNSHARAYLAYVRFKENDASLWIKTWATVLSEADTAFGCEECFEALVAPFAEAAAQFWAAVTAGLSPKGKYAPVVYYLNSLVSEEMQETKKALAYFQTALDLYPDFWCAAWGSAGVCINEKYYVKAVYFLEACLQNEKGKNVFGSLHESILLAPV